MISQTIPRRFVPTSKSGVIRFYFREIPGEFVWTRLLHNHNAFLGLWLSFPLFHVFYFFMGFLNRYGFRIDGLMS